MDMNSRGHKCRRSTIGSATPQCSALRIRPASSILFTLRSAAFHFFCGAFPMVSENAEWRPDTALSAFEGIVPRQTHLSRSSLSEAAGRSCFPVGRAWTPSCEGALSCASSRGATRSRASTSCGSSDHLHESSQAVSHGSRQPSRRCRHAPRTRCPKKRHVLVQNSIHVRGKETDSLSGGRNAGTSHVVRTLKHLWETSVEPLSVGLSALWGACMSIAPFVP